MDDKKFSHNRSPYERPSFPYRCGRGALWLKPCHQGPHLNGTCGGTTECSPYLNGNHWECNRPLSAGGPCEEGPAPQGECSLRHPPCVPKPTLRVYRGRLAILAIGAILSLIWVSWIIDQVQKNNLSFNPGPISSAHIKFINKDGCSVCHASHEEGPISWLRAVLKKQDISSKCGDCHLFGGPESKAHNGDVQKYPNLQDTQCLMCHREHRGPQMTIRQFSSDQCSFCHKTKVESFSGDHPEFPLDYPNSRKDSIKFDHITHHNKYFLDPKFVEHSPETCMDCHSVAENKIVNPGKFEVVCAKCHAFQIPLKDLVLVRLPELDKNRINRQAVLDTCGMPEERNSSSKKAEDEFISVSTETPSLVSAYLLNVPENEPEVYSQHLQDLIWKLAYKNTAPLATLIDNHSPVPIAEKMLMGLNPEVIKRAACAWALNVEYEPPAEASFGGWHADLLEIRYTPVGHKDTVAKSWIEFALAVAASEVNAEKSKRAIAMRDQMLSSKEGVGGCIKCHAVTAERSKEGRETLKIDWGYKGARNTPYVHFSHKSHLDILGKGNTCKNCHILNKNADYISSFDTFDRKKFVSNFFSINRKTCVECHAEGQVKQDCQLCHSYHLQPGFKKEMLLANKKL